MCNIFDTTLYQSCKNKTFKDFEWLIIKVSSSMGHRQNAKRYVCLREVGEQEEYTRKLKLKKITVMVPEFSLDFTWRHTCMMTNLHAY